MLKRIHIIGYKSLRDIDVPLGRLSVLLGPNAAGKSNLFDALQLLSRVATARTLKEAFDPPYRGKPLESFSFPPDGMEGLLRKRSVSMSFEADIELSDSIVSAVNQQIADMKRTSKDDEAQASGPDAVAPLVRERSLRYQITIEMLPASGIIRIADESLTALRPDGSPTGRRAPFLSLVEGHLRVRMEGQAHPTYYDQFLDHSILSLPLYPPHYPHLVAARQELASWLFFYLEPRERMRAPTPVKEVRHLGQYGEDLAAFLNTLRAEDPGRLHAIERALSAVIPTISGLSVSVNPLGEVELGVQEGDLRIPARLVSEGTLRILGLLALSGVKEQPGLIAFEEPENGINPRRIKLVAELLKNLVRGGNAQLIVTTHSPLLPDLLPYESLIVCRKRQGVSEVVPLSRDAFGPLGKFDAAVRAIDDEGENGLKVSERIQRGDFDA